MSTTNLPKQPNIFIVTIVTIVVLGGATIGTFAIVERESNQASSTALQVGSMGERPVEAAEYRDGEYSAVGMYTSPSGAEDVAVNVKIEDNTLIEATVEADSSSPTSRQFQRLFIDNFTALVIGKDVDEVELDRVAGSSLTSVGFNDAIEKIRDEARE